MSDGYLCRYVGVSDVEFEPIEMTARDMEFVELREITAEEVRSVAMPALPPAFEKPYGRSMAMYKLWWEATFGVTQCTI